MQKFMGQNDLQSGCVPPWGRAASPSYGRVASGQLWGKEAGKVSRTPWSQGLYTER